MFEAAGAPLRHPGPGFVVAAAEAKRVEMPLVQPNSFESDCDDLI
jgi:hypothetical protein